MKPNQRNSGQSPSKEKGQTQSLHNKYQKGTQKQTQGLSSQSQKGSLLSTMSKGKQKSVAQHLQDLSFSISNKTNSHGKFYEYAARIIKNLSTKFSKKNELNSSKYTIKELSSKLSYKSNINRMFYNEANLENLASQLIQGHKELFELVNNLQKNKEKQLQKDKQQKIESIKFMQKKQEQQVLQQTTNIQNTPQMATMINKFRKILEFDEHSKKTMEKKNQILLNIFQYYKSKKQLKDLKKQVQENQRVKTSLDNSIFYEIAKTIAPKFKQTVYLPTTLRVTLAGVNWMDKEDQTASVALKIEARVHIPGFFHYPKTYTKLLKEKFKMSLKTQSHSYLRNLKVDLKQKKQSERRQIIKGNDIFNDNINQQFHPNPYDYFTEVYKWKNYYSQRELYFKKIRDYEGCIIEVKVNDVKVKLNSIPQSAPFELIDFTGIIQLQSIQTRMNDWSEIIFSEKESYFRTFLEEMSPSVTLKFNIISLYRNDENISITKEILLNQIHSMDSVVKNQYYLAEKLLFIEPSNKRESNYELKRSWLSYYWKKLPSSSLDQLSQIPYKKKKKFYLKLKEDIRNQESSQLFIQFIRRIEKKFQTQQLEYKIIEELQKSINKIHEKQDLQPKGEEQIQKCLQVFQKLQKYLFNYEKVLQNQLKGNFKNKIRVTLEHVIGCTQKLRIKIKILTEYFIRKLHSKKISLRLRLKNQESQLEVKKNQIGQITPQIKKEIIDLNQDQIKQLQTYLNNGLLMDDQKIAEKETKYDHDYNQSKAIFHFPFYRNPGAVLVEIVISSIVLSSINLAIFFQDMHQISNIIASVSSLMISFIGMITIVQKQINSNSLSIIQFTFYLLFLTPIVSLIYSYKTVTFQNVEPKIEPTYQNKFMYLISNYLFCSANQALINDYENNGFFWYCFIVTILGLLIPILLSFRFCFLKYYSSTKIKTIKESEAISTLFPGSPDVDNIVFEKGSFQWSNKQNRQRTLHGVVISLITNYLLNLQQKRAHPEITEMLNKKISIKNQDFNKNFQNFRKQCDQARNTEIKNIKVNKINQKIDKQQQLQTDYQKMSQLAVNLKYVLSFSKIIVSNMIGQTKSNKNIVKKEDDVNQSETTQKKKDSKS